MSDEYVIFFKEVDNKLTKIKASEWATYPETDPKLGRSRAGWSFGPSLTFELHAIRSCMRQTVADVMRKVVPAKGGYGVGTSDPPLRLSEREWYYLYQMLAPDADKECECAVAACVVSLPHPTLSPRTCVQ